MSNEGKCDKRLLSLRVSLETCRGVEKKYRHEDDTDKGTAFIRALEDAVRDVHLSPEDYQIILNESRENLRKRMARRASK